MREKDYFEELDEQLKKKYREGIRELDRGNFSRAEEVLISFQEETPDFVPVYNKLAIMYIYKKDSEKARELLSKTLEMDKEYVPAVTNMGSLFKEEGNLEKAKEYYQRAMELDPEYGPAYNNLGVVLREQGEIAESIKMIKQGNKLTSFAVDELSNKKFYREKGCLVPIIVVVVIVVIILVFLR